MNIYDYIIIALIAACIITAIFFIVRAKKKGKHIGCGNCDGGCENCSKHISK